MPRKIKKETNNKFDNFLKFLKKHKEIIIIAAALATIFTIFVLPIISRGCKWLNYNFLTPNKIYLNLLDNQGRRISLKNNYSTIYMDIKENTPIVMRFSLIQNNDNAPEISTVFINFPSDAEVKPILADGRIWVRTNSPKNQYSIDYSDFRFTKGTYWDLPPFEVTFKKTKNINFEYSIIGNKMKNIDDRSVTIYTAKDVASDVLETEVIDVRNTASGPIIEYRRMSPQAIEDRE